jgi:hypothetical protein
VTTPIYGLRYLELGEPARNTRQVLQDNAETIEAALAAGGVAAPGAADLLAVSGRVSVLEAAAAARPVAILTGSAGTTPLTSGTWAPLPLAGVEERDDLGGHSTTTNPSRWTCPAGEGGLYWVVGTTRIDGATGAKSAGVRKNGAELTRLNGQVAGPAIIVGSTAGLVSLVPTDYLEVWALQSSGSALTANNAYNSLTLVRMFRT